MSLGAQTVTVAPSFERSTAADTEELSPRTRLAIRLASFTALALYGAIRWGTLMSPTATWRLIGLLALAVALAAAGPLLHRNAPPVALLLLLVICLLAFPIAGLQWHSFVHLRIVVGAHHIGDGLTALPNSLVPYNGTSHAVRLVIMLGAAVLLLDAATVIAFAPETFGDARRAGAALPLIALAVVPSTLVRPQFPYLQGLVLFALLAVFMWGERIRRDAVPSALAVTAVAGVVAALVAPRVDPHKAVLDYRAWAGVQTHHRVDAFDWNQTYGPLNWPHSGHRVLTVRAKTGDYWKAEDLDLFNGVDWVLGTPAEGGPLPNPSASALAAWTQTIHVTITGMSTTDVIAPGEAVQPNDVPGGVNSGIDPGRWLADRTLGPGTSYAVTAYSPHPSTSQLGAAGTNYPWTELGGELTVTVPERGTPPEAFTQATFAAFHSATKARLTQGGIEVPAPGIATLMHDSAYARAYLLARRLSARAKTPYDFVASVLRYLSRGYTYSQSPRLTSYPLATFLFKSRRGYCQQFSGAMALLLRMGGLPARVASGFTAGVYEPVSRQWVVSDIDAHAWVEVWFPQYGWVRFDPTPAVAPARGGQNSPGLAKIRNGSGNSLGTPGLHGVGSTGSSATGSHHGSGSGVGLATIVAALFGLAALVWVGWVVIRPSRGPDDLLGELERALARTRRPLAPETTLAALEHRYRDSAAAAGYIRSLRLIRYGDSTKEPTTHGRRALRAQLSESLGLTGRVRALWALPPRPASALRRQARGLKS